MSFANKGKDSKDTAALRKEYEAKAREFRETTDKGSKAKLKDDKAKLFCRVRDQIDGERRESLGAYQKVMTQMGKLKSREQLEAERATYRAQTSARIAAERR